MTNEDKNAQHEMAAFWREFAGQCAENIVQKRCTLAQGRRFLVPEGEPTPGKPVFDYLVYTLIDLHLENRQLAAL